MKTSRTDYRKSTTANCLHAGTTRAKYRAGDENLAVATNAYLSFCHALFLLHGKFCSKAAKQRSKTCAITRTTNSELSLTCFPDDLKLHRADAHADASDDDDATMTSSCKQERIRTNTADKDLQTLQCKGTFSRT